MSPSDKCYLIETHICDVVTIVGVIVSEEKVFISIKHTQGANWDKGILLDIAYIIREAKYLLRRKRARIACGREPSAKGPDT